MAEPVTLFSGRIFRVARIRHQTRAGATVERDVIFHPGAVTIVPMVDAGHVCLLRNYRAAVDDTLIELPAGTLEAGELPAVTAERELIEETGYRAGRIEPLGACWMSPGILRERMHLFVATSLTPGPPAREANEEIENLVVPWEQAVQWTRDGTIQDAKSIAAILLYDAQRRGG